MDPEIKTALLALVRSLTKLAASNKQTPFPTEIL